MKTTYPCTADRPELLAFVASLPDDPERDRLIADYRRLADAYVTIVARAGEIQPRVDAVVTAMLDADGQRRETLLAEYASLAGELDLQPRLRSQVARAFAGALTAWASSVRAQAVRAHQDADREITRIVRELTPHRKQVAELEQSAGLQAANQERFDRAQADIARLLREMQPCRARQNQAQRIVDMIDLAVSRAFGDDCRLLGPTPLHIERFVAAQAKQAA
ncbi:MAG: hypothetical protein ACR2OE_07675 [Thermomicrobiales bacterium]